MTERTTSHAALPPTGTPVTIVKLRPDGSEAIRYPGSIIDAPRGWVAARAPWEQRRIDLGYLVFEPDDVFLEFFSLEDPFNVFAVFTHEGTLKGWYSNVTHPTWVRDETIYWQDLYIDVISYPDRGDVLVLDEDELADADVEQSDPALYQIIARGRERLLSMVAESEYPFTERRLPE